MLQKLFEIHQSLIAQESTYAEKRYLYDQIDWTQRLIAIKGARGVGKTTLLLQYYSENFNDPKDCLYFSADLMHVAQHGLYAIAESFFQYGGQVLLIDEIHKYPNWSVELKNLYDVFPSKQIIFSGSSTIHISHGKADLSRRALMYTLKGLSFREFLNLTTEHQFDTLSVEEILHHHTSHTASISKKVSALRHFQEYLHHGYYPFFLEGPEHYLHRLNNVIEKVLYEDIPSLHDVKFTTIHRLKKLFYIVGTSVPFTMNVTRLSRQLGISKESLYLYIEEMQQSGLFLGLYPQDVGLTLARKPQKLYLENPTLFAVVEEEHAFPITTGSIRECFFFNQFQNGTSQSLYTTPEADFLDRHQNYYDIGGPNKTPNPSSKKRPPSSSYYLLKDGIPHGHQNTIPLWLFGFLY